MSIRTPAEAGRRAVAGSTGRLPAPPVARPCVRLAGFAVAALVGAVSHGQDPDARFDAWQKVEGASETRTYKEAMRNGNAFDAAARTYLEQIALPQLGAEGNRGTIAYVRRRIREQLLTEFGNEKAAEDANKAVSTFMESVAANGEQPPPVRINAMLMIGELIGADRKPWGPAAATLARDAASAELPAGVRIAAVVGLARHVDAAKGNAAATAKLGQVLGPVIKSILEEPVTPQNAVERDWMASRCLAMLAQLGPANAETVAVVVRAIADEAQSFDARVRAAAALAAAVGKDAKTDGVALIRSIDDLAVAALRSDMAIADRIRLERAFGGGAMLPGSAPPGMMPGMAAPSSYAGPAPGYGSPSGMPGGEMVPGQPPVEQLIPREVCRRAAWRLVTLADAVLTADGQKGLALLPGVDAAEAKPLAAKLRRAAMDLDANPDDVRIRQALDDLRPPPPPEEDDDEAPEDAAAGEKDMTDGDAAGEAAPAADGDAKPAGKAAGTAKPAAAAGQ